MTPPFTRPSEYGDVLTSSEDPLLPVVRGNSLHSLLDELASTAAEDSSHEWEADCDSLIDFDIDHIGPSQSWIDFFQSLSGGSIQELLLPEGTKDFIPKIEGERRRYQRFREKKFVCDDCGRCFTLKQNVQQHVVNYHMNGERELKIRRGKRYKCLKCDQVFKTMELAKRHDATKHASTAPNSTIFSCEHCGKVYGTRAQLKEHDMINHQMARPFRCNLCGTRFGRKGGLRRHMQMVHENQVFKCSFPGCNHPGYKCSKALAAHVRSVHTKDRPFACMLCERTFVRKNDLKTHELTHSASSHLKCPDCDKEFKRATSLAAHKKRCRVNAAKADGHIHVKIEMGDHIDVKLEDDFQINVKVEVEEE